MKKTTLFLLSTLFLLGCAKAPAPLDIEGVWKSDAPPYWILTVSDGYLEQRIPGEPFGLDYAYRTDGDTVFLTPFIVSLSRKQVWRIEGERAEVEEIGNDLPAMNLKKLSE